jgi:hypothetical protein
MAPSEGCEGAIKCFTSCIQMSHPLMRQFTSAAPTERASGIVWALEQAPLNCFSSRRPLHVPDLPSPLCEARAWLEV